MKLSLLTLSLALVATAVSAEPQSKWCTPDDDQALFGSDDLVCGVQPDLVDFRRNGKLVQGKVKPFHLTTHAHMKGDDNMCKVAKLTYEENVAECTKLDARMCTSQELLNGEAKNSGCRGTNKKKTWSDTVCKGGNGVFSVKKGGEGKAKCVKTGKKNKLYPTCCNEAWSAAPTAAPTEEPTFEPTSQPTSQPTFEPTSQPTSQPTATPTTAQPTATPTTLQPTASPSLAPTAEVPLYESTWFPNILDNVEAHSSENDARTCFVFNLTEDNIELEIHSIEMPIQWRDETKNSIGFEIYNEAVSPDWSYTVSVHDFDFSLESPADVNTVVLHEKLYGPGDRPLLNSFQSRQHFLCTKGGVGTPTNPTFTVSKSSSPGASRGEYVDSNREMVVEDLAADRGGPYVSKLMDVTGQAPAPFMVWRMYGEYIAPL